MTTTYHSDQSFLQLVSDAIYFYKASVETTNKYDTQRFSRSSILNSTLSIEAAANCCLHHINGSKQFIDEVEKTTTFAKLDLFALSYSKKKIDRGCFHYQKVAELKKVRDSFVHPKKLRIPVELSIDEEKHEDFIELGLNFEGNPYPATKIDRSSMFWFSNDAKSALESIFDFYGYFFVDLLELKPEEILGVLGNAIVLSNESYFTFHPRSLTEDLLYLKKIGIENRVIHLESVPQVNTSKL